jgi:hypothetical protein
MVESTQVERSQSPDLRRLPMLSADEKEKLERGFAESEASVFLAG